MLVGQQCVERIVEAERIEVPMIGPVHCDFREEVLMNQYILAFAALTMLTVGTAATANAVEFGVGPGGAYVGPDRPHGYYRDGGECRTVITHRINRYGERVEVRRQICD
jgi:hypothetical protein